MSRGKREPWQSEDDYEAGKPLGGLFWLTLIVVVAYIIDKMLGG